MLLMILTLAGPGAGKTTDMVNQIESCLSELNINREAAIITYTNASVKEIQRKVSSVMVIPRNVFIGTMHSFLINYFIRPYAASIVAQLGYDTTNITVVNRLSDIGTEWISDWVDNKNSEKSVDERKQIKKYMLQKYRNNSIHAAAKKGIYTYDGIIKIAKELSENTDIMKLIANKVQFLFVDEYQDISSYGHSIIMQIEKRSMSKVYVVGDPDQSIYRFRYGESQIAEKAPKKEKYPIRQLITDNKKCVIRELTINHRSSKEIVEFIRKYSTLAKQEPEKESICKIQFIDSADPYTIVKCLIEINKKYDCLNDCMIVAKKEKCLKLFSNILEQSEEIRSEKKDNENDCDSIIDDIVALSGESYSDFISKYSMTRFDLRRLAVSVRRKIGDNSVIDEKIVNECYMELYAGKIHFKNSVSNRDDGSKITYNFEAKSSEKLVYNNEQVRCMTIHKSKGLEADSVLVIAENSKQLFKWLNMKKKIWKVTRMKTIVWVM